MMARGADSCPRGGLPVETEEIGVAVVEDEEDVRESLGLIVAGTPGMRCAGLFPDGRSALRGIPDLGPGGVDVALVDIGLPDISGVEVARRLKARNPELEIMMLTVFEDEERIFQSLRAGATGYLLKRTPPAELLQAVRELAAGGSPMTGRIARRVVQAFHGPARSGQELTPREREVLDLLAEGRRYREISRRLGLSLETVRTHIRHIYEKLQVHSRTEAVMKEYGLVPSRDPGEVNGT